MTDLAAPVKSGEAKVNDTYNDLRELAESELDVVSGGSGEVLDSGPPPYQPEERRAIRVDRAYRK